MNFVAQAYERPAAISIALAKEITLVGFCCLRSTALYLGKRSSICTQSVFFKSSAAVARWKSIRAHHCKLSCAKLHSFLPGSLPPAPEERQMAQSVMSMTCSNNSSSRWYIPSPSLIACSEVAVGGDAAAAAPGCTALVFLHSLEPVVLCGGGDANCTCLSASGGPMKTW